MACALEAKEIVPVSWALSIKFQINIWCRTEPLLLSLDLPLLGEAAFDTKPPLNPGLTMVTKAITKSSCNSHCVLLEKHNLKTG